MREAILANRVLAWGPASPAYGRYSPGFKVSGGSLIFMAGQVAVDAEGKLVGKGDAAAQTRQIFENIKTVLEAAGGTLDDLVKLNVFVVNLADREAISAVRSQYLPREPFPASTLVGVTGLANPDFLLEIEGVAFIEGT